MTDHRSGNSCSRAPTRHGRWAAQLLLPIAMAVLQPASETVAQANTTFSIVNNSSLTISYIYVSPANVEQWGRDWLGSGVLRAGGRFRVAPGGDAGCFYDVRVVYSNDQSEERRNQNLCTMSEMVFNGPAGSRGGNGTPAAVDTTFDIVNRSSQSMLYIYVSPASADQWGRDWLGSDTLSAGGRFRVAPGSTDGCMYDVRVVYVSEQSEERRAQNLCRTSEIVFDGAASAAPPSAAAGGRSPAQRSFGTGFFVSAQGHALTNHHVVDDCGSIVALTGAGAVPAQLVRRDERNDLALLRVQVTDAVAFGRFRAAPGIRPGEGVVVAGYPLPDVLQNGLNVTVGNVSALAGVGGNAAIIQMTAPVQPGNSGGPLLDMGGNIVGVVASKLDAMRLAETTGDIPQNVNFAVQGAIARLFLEAEGQHVEERSSAAVLPVGDVVDGAREFTFQVECRP